MNIFVIIITIYKVLIRRGEIFKWGILEGTDFYLLVIIATIYSSVASQFIFPHPYLFCLHFSHISYFILGFFSFYFRLFQWWHENSGLKLLLYLVNKILFERGGEEGFTGVGAFKKINFFNKIGGTQEAPVSAGHKAGIVLSKELSVVMQLFKITCSESYFRTSKWEKNPTPMATQSTRKIR